MIKAFLLIISILTAFNEFHVTGQICDHEGFYVGYRIKILCNGQDHNTVNFAVRSCEGRRPHCKTYVPDETRENDEYTGSVGPFFNDNSGQYLEIEHMCRPCKNEIVSVPIVHRG
uniref:SVWC domain-containing protein n=1 Tax=Parastrongyloides trichosuri TaxID=131310 RepID=A0A0N5A160_PARTI